MDPNISTAIALGAFFVWALVIWKRLASLKREVSAALARAEAEAQRLRDLAPTGRHKMRREPRLIPSSTPARWPRASTPMSSWHRR